MPNMTPYEPTVNDIKFFIERAKRYLDDGDLDGAIKEIQSAQLLEDALVIYRLHQPPGLRENIVQSGGPK